MNNPKHGNRVILLVLAIVMAVATIFVQWGVITLTADDVRESMTINGQRVSDESLGGMLGGMMSSMLVGVPVPVTGLNGSLVLGPLKIPYWLAIAAVVIGLLLTVTNSVRFSDVSQKLVFGLLVAGIVSGAWSAVVLLTRGSIGVGPLLLIGASVIGLTQQGPLKSDH